MKFRKYRKILFRKFAILGNIERKTMNDEQYYLFVDKSGHCFEDFQKVEDGLEYNRLIGAWLRGGRKFIVGDMLVFRDDLTNAGFEWGIDFFVKKVDKS